MIPTWAFLTVGVTVGIVVGKLPLSNAALEGVGVTEDCTNTMSVECGLELDTVRHLHYWLRVLQRLSSKSDVPKQETMKDRVEWLVKTMWTKRG
jgi:hypothetical protein